MWGDGCVNYLDLGKHIETLHCNFKHRQLYLSIINKTEKTETSWGEKVQIIFLPWIHILNKNGFSSWNG